MCVLQENLAAFFSSAKCGAEFVYRVTAWDIPFSTLVMVYSTQSGNDSHTTSTAAEYTRAAHNAFRTPAYKTPAHDTQGRVAPPRESQRA